MAHIAVVGAGNMGGRMARRLLAAGHTVFVSDLNVAAVEALVAEGAIGAFSAAEASATAEFVLTSLPHPAIFSAVIDEVAQSARAGTVVLDVSTVDPSTSRAASETLARTGVKFLDTPVSGGPTGAEAGTLVAMVGGPDDVLEQSRPVLDVIAGRIVHCGDTGTGQLTKLAHNLLTAINTAALGEVLTAAVAEGADLRILSDVLTAGLAGSKMLDYLPKTLFTQERPANFALDLMNKDIGLALDEFGRRPMYLGQLTRQLYNTATAQGAGREDSTGVATVYERLNEVRLSL